MFNNTKTKIRVWWFHATWDIKCWLAVRKAKRLGRLYHCKVLVVRVGNSPRVYKRKDLKELVHRGYFQKGVTIETLTKYAIYVYHPWEE